MHDDIVVNLIASCASSFEAADVGPSPATAAWRRLPVRIRRPDVGVDCGARNPNASKATLPKLVIEVLSPSTRDFNSFAKLEEYKQVSTIDYVVLIEPNEPIAAVWARDDQGQWVEKRVHGLDQKIDMPRLRVALRMDAIYESVAFAAGPRIVSSDLK